MSLRPLNRGTSILAALVFIALLGGVALAVNVLSPSQHLASLDRKAFVADTGTAADRGIKDLRNDLNANCDTTRKSAAAGQSQSSKEMAHAKTETDTCVAAIYKPSNGHARKDDYLSYQCVGKSATITIDGKANETINANAAPGVTAGMCSTVACGPSSGGQSTCIQANLTTLDKAKIQSFLDGSAPDDGTSYRQFSLSDDAVKSMMDARSTDELSKAFQGGALSAQEAFAASQLKTTNLEQQLAAYQSGCAEVCDATSQQKMAETQAALDAERLKQAHLQEGMGALAQARSDLNGGSVPSACKTSSCDDTKNGTYGGPPKDTFPKDPPRLPPADPRKSNAEVPGGGGPGGGGGGLPSGLSSLLGGLLQGFAKGMQQSAGQGSGQACPSDPNAYAQQQQQYNQQLQQYNMQLQQYNYQYQYSQYSGYPPPPPPLAPQSCTPNNNSNTCAATPAQPTGSCAGSWQPIRTQQSNGATCTAGWQCVPSNVTTPTAQISCNPLVADTGMSVAIAFSCTNATGSTGQGFDTANATSGSATATLGTTTSATTTTFGITCVNQTLTANAQCSVQVGRPAIVLVATPKIVAPGKTSAIGWVTSGMQSCVVSSPTLVDFTAQNATNTSPSGIATTPALATSTDFLLSCASVGGTTKSASTTVIVSTTSTATSTSQ